MPRSADGEAESGVEALKVRLRVEDAWHVGGDAAERHRHEPAAEPAPAMRGGRDYPADSYAPIELGHHPQVRHRRAAVVEPEVQRPRRVVTPVDVRVRA